MAVNNLPVRHLWQRCTNANTIDVLTVNNLPVRHLWQRCTNANTIDVLTVNNLPVRHLWQRCTNANTIDVYFPIINRYMECSSHSINKCTHIFQQINRLVSIYLFIYLFKNFTRTLYIQ